MLYLSYKRMIPSIVATNPKIIQRLVLILETMKLRNKTISSIHVSSVARNATPADLLQSLASRAGVTFSSTESVEGCQTFEVGSYIVAVKDGALHILQDGELVPIMVNSFVALISKK